MNNFDKRYELYCLKCDFDILSTLIIEGKKYYSLATYINRYYDTITDVIKLYSRLHEQIKRDTNRIIRLKQELYKSNKNSNKYYTALKNINELCTKNSCTSNPEYLSDLLYDIERNVVDALSDGSKTCKTKD